MNAVNRKKTRKTIRRVIVLVLTTFFLPILCACHTRSVSEYEFVSDADLYMASNAKDVYPSINSVDDTELNSLVDTVNLQRLASIEKELDIVSGPEILVAHDVYVHKYTLMVSVQPLSKSTLDSYRILRDIRNESELLRIAAHYLLVSRYQQSVEFDSEKEPSSKCNQDAYIAWQRIIKQSGE